MPDDELQALGVELKSKEASDQSAFSLGKEFLDDSEWSAVVHLSLIKVGIGSRIAVFKNVYQRCCIVLPMIWTQERTDCFTSRAADFSLLFFLVHSTNSMLI